MAMVFVVCNLLMVSADAGLFGGGKDKPGEYLIVSGGPALEKWEKLRPNPHDRWWGNFIRSARFRMLELIKQDPKIEITWLVYRPAYTTRGAADGVSRIGNILGVPDRFANEYKHPIKFIWFDKTSELIAYVNDRKSGKKVSGFEYFGHSNKYAFMFEYSNRISGASHSWLHESDLRRFRKRAFKKDAYCKSWGCHSGTSFCQAFRKATGASMWGATDKTDYSVLQYDQLPIVIKKGKWVKP